MAAAMGTRKQTRKTREVGADDARQQLGQWINRAGAGEERVILTRHGLPVAGLVSIADIKTLEALDES